MKPSSCVLAVCLLALGACRSQQPDPRPSASVPPPSTSGAPTSDAARDEKPVDAGATSATASATSSAPIAEGPLEGTDFKDEVRAAFRVAACAGDDAWIPAAIDRGVVDKHCEGLKPLYTSYKTGWIDVAGPFIANIRPKDLPVTVVYPFGGGDLVSELTTYPDTKEVTTISLEIAGDIRRVTKGDRKIGEELKVLRDHLSKLFDKAHSRTVNLELEQFHAIPAEVAFTMAALALHGYEPIGFRYFSFNKDGTLKYLSNDELTKRQTDRSRQGPFANAEVRFAKKGESSVRVLRHVAYDLSDPNTKGSPLLKHLEAKGKVSTMTKAASHLLWDDGNFAILRDYLMTHTDWMISDTTGVPPRIAKKYGFTQDVYGAYVWAEPFGTVNNADIQAFVDLFKTAKPISFRYGYPDNKSHGHIVVTRKP